MWSGSILGLQAETRAATGSVANAFEVALCTDLCRLISHSGLAPTVAVIAMYAEQVAQLRRPWSRSCPGPRWLPSTPSRVGRLTWSSCRWCVPTPSRRSGSRKRESSQCCTFEGATPVGDHRRYDDVGGRVDGDLRSAQDPNERPEPKGFAKTVGPGAMVPACGRAKVTSDTKAAEGDAEGEGTGAESATAADPLESEASRWLIVLERLQPLPAANALRQRVRAHEATAIETP